MLTMGTDGYRWVPKSAIILHRVVPTSANKPATLTGVAHHWGESVALEYSTAHAPELVSEELRSRDVADAGRRQGLDRIAEVLPAVWSGVEFASRWPKRLDDGLGGDGFPTETWELAENNGERGEIVSGDGFAAGAGIEHVRASREGDGVRH